MNRRFSFILLGLSLKLQQTARQHPVFRAHIAGRDITAQIKLAGGRQGRHFRFKNGKISSRKGVHPDPDVCLTFSDAAAAVKLLGPEIRIRLGMSRSGLQLVMPPKDAQEQIDAIKNFRVDVQGDEAHAAWFVECLNLLQSSGWKCGTELGNGVTRYVSNTQGGPLFVHVKDGRILRMMPIDHEDEDAAPWTIEARGRRFSPPRKTTLSPFALGWKSLVYSPDRLLYPMKRVDFDPEGERNCHRRGVSGYERISWDEALDIVAGEIKRVKRDHGPGAILTSTGAHHSFGNLGHYLSAHRRFSQLLGTTDVFQNPHSFEGWAWGAVNHWGNSLRRGAGEPYGTVEDALKHCEMMVFWAGDPESSSGLYAAFEGTLRRQWLKELGVEMVHIDPFYNHTAAFLGGKWIAPRPDTGNVLALAIAHVWITEELYDHGYVENRTTGFDVWRAYILGQTDGTAKTPEWQQAETGVPAEDVRALARRWGRRKTYLAAGAMGNAMGGACRSATGIEWARSMVCLMAMQGLGKPGVNMANMSDGAPVDTRFFFPGYAEGGLSGDLAGTSLALNMYQRMPQLPTINSVSQKIALRRLPEAILEGQCTGFTADPKTIEGQFAKASYPAAGYAPAQLYYKYGGSHIGTASESNRYVEMYRSDKLSFVVNQSIWKEGEANFADILLPACTQFERWDISEFANAGGIMQHAFTRANSRVITLQHKCIEPLGESKSDYNIFWELSKRLGMGAVFSEGCSELDWCKRMFDASDLPDVISWEAFLKKGYYVVPPPEAELRAPCAFRWFAEDRPKDVPETAPLPADYTEAFRRGLQTQSGKVEFEASSLKRFAPDDPERLPIPTYIPSWEGHRTTALYAKYPLQLITPHPRFSFHTMHDGKDGAMVDVEEHRMWVDGYPYWIVRLNADDAADRDISTGDLVKVFNDRGAIICAALATRRLRAGTALSFSNSSTYDPIGEPGRSPDRGGCVNLLSSKRNIIRNSHATAPNSCLVQINSWTPGP